MTGQGSHRTRLQNERRIADKPDPWIVIRRALNRMAGASSARALLDILVRTALRLTSADVAQVDLYVPMSECFVLGGLAGKDTDPAPLCPTPHRNALARAVLNQGQPLYRDLDAHSDGFAEHIRQIFVVPMLGNSLRGVILIGYQQASPHPEPEAAQMLDILTAQASLMLYQLGQRREGARRSSHLALIDEVGRLIVETSDRVLVWDQVLDEVSETFDLCGALLYTGEPPSLYAARSEVQAPVGGNLDRGLARRALDSGRPLISKHAGLDDRCVVPAWLEADIGSEIAVPLTYCGDVIGVLDCFNSEDCAFDSLDLQTLRTIGRQIAPVMWGIGQSNRQPISGIEPLSLLGSADRSMDREAQALHDMTRQGNDNTDLDEGPAQRRKRLKAAYRQLREFAKLKDHILQNISHELRTPLTLIKGHVELVLDDPEGQLTPDQRRGLEIVMDKSDEVVNIVERIVSLSPMTSFALEQTSIPVRPLLESMAQLVAKRVTDRPIRIHVQDVEPDLCIYGDFDKIKQVCYNILENSIKFSPRGGDILMRANSEGAYVHLQFRDHGVGIPQQRISRIFDTFYQVDGSSTRQFGGLGLGLTVVHRIVDAHHGKVWAESKEGCGSTFHVLLPRGGKESGHQWDVGNE